MAENQKRLKMQVSDKVLGEFEEAIYNNINAKRRQTKFYEKMNKKLTVVVDELSRRNNGHKKVDCEEG